MTTLDSTKDDFYVVGVGASAGGLEALERFFTHSPPHMGVSYVVIQHLSANYKSMMDDLIHRYTALPISMITNGMPIEKDHVYLISAGTLVMVKKRRFVVANKNERTLTLPIDIFFKSLAEDVGDKAIGVILSGTGSDGSRGALAINAAGGFVLAQQPEDSKFDGMPKSAIATGIIDKILSAQEIPNYIANFLQSPMIRTLKEDRKNNPNLNNPPQEEVVHSIFKFMFRKFSIDFSHYKEATLLRRIERRMQVQHASRFEEYLDLLEKDSNEGLALRRELLIPVTSFLRNSDVFDFLHKHSIDKLIEEADAKSGIRAWVAGCSTGEEAYSLAMLFLERISELQKWVPVKIFATDLNPEVIDFASAGRFPESINAEMPDRLLQRFFVKEDEFYSVSNELRQSIVFAKHNLLADAPFTKMDLVSCRNTLIYFQNEGQRIALQKLKYATRVDGILVLGKSETLPFDDKSFVPVNNKLKIYRCRERNIPSYMSTGDMGVTRQSHVKDKQHVFRRAPVLSTAEEGLKLLQSHFFPASMLINERNELVHVYREVRDYINIRPGQMSYSVAQVLSEKLVPIVTALLFRVRKEKSPVSSEEFLYQFSNGEHQKITLHGYPLQQSGSAADILLVIKEMGPPPEEDNKEKLNIDQVNTQRTVQLEQELGATRESLQSTIEELETTNEELQATNEELMASNEELQSSNEELQSVNEELNTVNAEYHEKMNILTRMNSDLDAMSEASGIPTIFLDEKLNLTRYTPDALEVFHLRDLDVGRPLEEIVHKLDYPTIFQDVRRTLRTGITMEKQVHNNDGHEYLVRMVQYSLTSLNVRGIVISFIDISALKASERLQHVIDALPEHIAVLDPSGKIALVNQSWNQFAKANGDPDLNATGLGSNYLDVCGRTKDDTSAKKAMKGIKAVLEGSLSRFSLEYPCHSETEERWFAMEVVPVRHEPFGAVVSHFNISAWKLKTEGINE